VLQIRTGMCELWSDLSQSSALVWQCGAGEDRTRTDKNSTCLARGRFLSACVGVASCGALRHVPHSIFGNLFFKVYFGAAHSLTVTLCGYLSKHFMVCDMPLLWFNGGYINNYIPFLCDELLGLV